MVSEKSKENLKRARKLTTDEARKIGQNGGKKSAEVRAKRKSLREDLLAVLETEQSNGKTVQENWAIALSKRLLKGDVKAAAFVRDTIGEKPKDVLEVSADSTMLAYEKAAKAIREKEG